MIHAVATDMFTGWTMLPYQISVLTEVYRPDRRSVIQEAVSSYVAKQFSRLDWQGAKE
jgi:hypothetical protein